MELDLARDATGALVDDGVRLSEGERLAEPWFREVAAATRRLAQSDRNTERRLGYLLARHLAFNRLRLAQLFGGLEPHERPFLAALPYLLDAHQSDLPGYHPGARALTGVYNFEPNDAMRDAVDHLFARDIGRRALSRHAPPIRAVFVDTDVGTLVQRDPPTLTVYCVVDLGPRADRAANLLAGRYADLARYAATLGVDLRGVTLDPARVAAGEFGPYQSAHAAHALEAFYRSAIYLAGQLPAWWGVPAGTPPREHPRHATTIERVDTDVSLAFFDLGPVVPPTDRQRLRAAVARLEDSELGPLVTCLDLARLVHDLDRPAPPACEQLKRAIHGKADGDPITDPILARFDDAIGALRRAGEHADADTLETLAWLKVGLYLARTTTHADTFLDRFHARAGPCVTRWGYRRALLDTIDALTGWPRDAVAALDRDVRGFILRLYQRLGATARARPDLLDDDAMAALGRRLIALLGAEPARVRLHFDYLIEESRAEDHLVLLEQPDAPRRARWVVHRHVIRQGKDDGPDHGEEPMWTGDSLAAAAAWAVINGVFGRQTAVRLLGGGPPDTAADLRDVFDAIDHLVERPDPLRRPPHVFREPRRIRRAALIATHTPTAAERGELGTVRVLPENWDILNYGSGRRSRIRDISVVTLDTWDTVNCHRYRGDQALMRALRTIYGRFDVAHPLERPPDVLVPHGSAARATTNRLRQVLRDVDRISVAARPGLRRAFLYEVGGRFQVLSRDEARVTVCGVRSMRGALRLLGAVGEDDQHITVDRLSPTLGEIRALAERRRTDPSAEICVGWKLRGGEALVLVCDEVGRLYGREVTHRQLEPLLLRLVRRIIHRIRTRVRDTRTLRRTLRVYEMREGDSLGADVQLREDTVRVISLLTEPRRVHPELFLRGHLGSGRDGVWIEYGDRKYDPRERGRRFALDLVRDVIGERDRYPQFDLFIEASSVRFGDTTAADRERGVVKHLRLIDLYERHLARALRALRDDRPSVMKSEARFSRKAAP